MTKKKASAHKPHDSGHAAKTRPLRIVILALALAVALVTVGVFLVPQKKLPPALGKLPAVTALYSAKARLTAGLQKAGNKTPAATQALPKQQGYTNKDREKLDLLIESEMPK